MARLYSATRRPVSSWHGPACRARTRAKVCSDADWIMPCHCGETCRRGEASTADYGRCDVRRTWSYRLADALPRVTAVPGPPARHTATAATSGPSPAAGARVQLGILGVVRGNLDEARPLLEEALGLSLAAAAPRSCPCAWPGTPRWRSPTATRTGRRCWRARRRACVGGSAYRRGRSCGGWRRWIRLVHNSAGSVKWRVAAGLGTDVCPRRNNPSL